MTLRINNYGMEEYSQQKKERKAKKMINDENMIQELQANFELYKLETGDDCKFIDFVIGAYVEAV